MSVRLVERAGSAIAARTSRRGFLNRSALAGAALVTVPTAYVLRPGTAYAAICSCNNQSCNCDQTCCDGYTEFCCTTTGENTCPTGSIPAGWWKVDGSSFCVTNGSRGPRYYLDCNADLQGHVVRVVSLEPPICVTARAPTVTATTARRVARRSDTASATSRCRVSARSCVESSRARPPGSSTPRARRRPQPTTTRAGITALPRTADAGTRLAPGHIQGRGLDARLPLSSSSWVPLETFTYGQAGDIPVMGDWNGDGTHTVGVVRGNRWLLRNSNTAGNADIDFVFGKVGDIPVVGDWEGRGRTGIGVRRGTRNRWNLRHTASAGSPQIRIRFGVRATHPSQATGTEMAGRHRDHTSATPTPGQRPDHPLVPPPDRNNRKGPPPLLLRQGRATVRRRQLAWR